MTAALAQKTTMRAIVFYRYGSPDVLAVEDIDKPVVGDDQVLVRVHASSVNPYDWHNMRGHPYLMRMGAGLRRPKSNRMGVDVAGHVEAVGRDVTQFKLGDEVFGFRGGALAEYVVGRERNFEPKPVGLTFEQAAAVPLAAQTALQALRDKGQLQSGQKVLINGASGGVGTFAVQIAKAYGAHVTAVCSTRNVDLVRSIGADHVIDYTREDFARGEQRYDLVFDIAGNRSLSDLRRVLSPSGILVFVGAQPFRWLGPIPSLLGALIVRRFVSQKLLPLLARNSKDDLVVLKELIEAGKIAPVIDRTYPLAATPEAMRYLEAGHANAKVVITV